MDEAMPQTLRSKDYAPMKRRSGIKQTRLLRLFEQLFKFLPS
jgi:hypothetical protein